MDRKKALISQTIFKTKNEMRVHIRFASTSNNFRVRGVVVPMPYLPLRKVRRPNSICEVCILSEIERVTSLTVNKPKYPPPPPPPFFQVPKPSVTILQLLTMDQLLWVGTVNRQQQCLVVMKDTRWMEVKFYTVDQMDSGVKTNQLVKVGIKERHREWWLPQGSVGQLACWWACWHVWPMAGNDS